ncbi:MAG: proline dehydrogenase family protein [Pseudarcicella sp.]|nr:proline dehydrogenase family protein [Pseudarcicella sp.]MBP6409493.1 proline dehydrogenase family protein [Pseudarcicella sp.]
MQVQPIVNKPTSVSFEDTSVAFSIFSNQELQKLHFILRIMNQVWLAKLGTFVLKLCLFLRFPVKGLIKSAIFERFCGGENITECDKLTNKLYKNNIGSVLDFSVDVDSQKSGYDLYFDEVIKSIENAHKYNKKSFAVFKISSLCNPVLLEKVGIENVVAEEDLEEWKGLHQRVEALCFKASYLEVRVFIEAEESWLQNAIDMLAFEMMAKYNTDKCIVFNTFQMYRVDMLDNLKLAIDNAKASKYLLGVKLVRGAYLEKERSKAHEENYCEPIFKLKSETDISYNQAISLCVSSYKDLCVCVGTHNYESCQILCDLMSEIEVEHSNPHFIFSQLLGFSDCITFNLSSKGYNVVKFIPYGPIEDAIPFLLHRAEDNPDITCKTLRDIEMVKMELNRRKSLQAV